MIQPTINVKRIAWITLIVIASTLVVASFFVSMFGEDLHKYYIPFAKGCDICGFNPYYARWFFLPLALLPDNQWAMPLWSIMVFTGMF